LSGHRETAYAKINLALHVRERMPDGYHRIETIFAFCEDGDELTAEASESVSLEVCGTFASALRGDGNLATAAAEALRKVSRADDGAAIQLRKQLPVAAGLGGGSADAAATLRLLNRLWRLDWSADDLESVGAELGADIRACVRSETVRGEGRGDVLQSADLGLTGIPVLLINPRVELPTAEVFARWEGTDRGPLVDWRQGRNDLEQAARSLAPQIQGMIAWLSAQPGATFVRMSGSGPTCFAFFESEADRDQSAEAVPREWWRLATRLR
jgi:4-diphosphocytidyl-2-C-methyl-D-erythritol kinase